MEYLVTMTTRVPEGVTDETVDEVRGREAVRSRQLAADGHLLRLWRPPLEPGEWRTFGLFAADDPDALEAVLASMPLRVWRTDEVTALESHANDPAAPTPYLAAAREYFTTFTVNIPEDADQESVDDALAGEAEGTRKLAAAGNLVRLWRLDNGKALGLWRATDDAEIRAILAALPLAKWFQVETIPLTRHPSDPAYQATEPA
jgi:muconolactone delta-isomerase